MLTQRARHMAEEKHEYLTWRAGDQAFALPVSRCREIMRTGRITVIPGAHPALPGVTNLRGEVVPLLDLRLLLGMSGKSTGRVLIRLRASEGTGLCILVDRVKEILSVQPEAVQEVPASLAGIDAKYIRGVFLHKGELHLILEWENLKPSRSGAPGQA